MILFVDAFSRFSCIMGLHDKSYKAMAITLKQFASKFGLVDTFSCIGKIKANGG